MKWKDENEDENEDEAKRRLLEQVETRLEMVTRPFSGHSIRASAKKVSMGARRAAMKGGGG